MWGEEGEEDPPGPTVFYDGEGSGASSDGEAVGNPAPTSIAYPTPSADPNQNQSVVRTTDAPVNGTATVTALATITRNAMAAACTAETAEAECGPERFCAAVDGLGSFCAGEREFDSLVAEVLLCENPWPARDRDGSWEPFVDVSTQFSFYYCRDAGEAGTTFDDLPEPLDVVSIPHPAGSGILVDLLVPMDCASAGAGLCEEGDALGVRVVANSEHLSALRWYSAQGFTGSPGPRDVDGYPGIVDGRTVYVNAGNKVGDPLYTNIYLISYNEGASDALRGIYNQMLGNWGMNWNLLDQGVCREDTSISCSSDLDCAGSVCLAPKEKFRRDVVRLQDFREIESALETYRTLNQHCSASTDRACFTDANCPTGETCVGEYPGLEAGSFLRGRTNSKWPSWQSTLGNALGAAIPADPLNRLASCPAGADPDTCWNISDQTFVCPDGSQVYRYDRQGRGYSLGADFELKLCSDSGAACADDADCGGANCAVRGWDPDETKPASHVEGAVTVDNVWNLDQVCTGETFNAGTLCGDGLVGPDEECDGAMTRLDECVMANGREGFARVACTNECVFQNIEEVACEAGRCGDGVVQGPAEICDDGDLNGTFGRCNFDCTELGDHCGDGRIKPGVERCDQGGFCSRAPEVACEDDSDCGGDQGQCLGTTTYARNQADSCAFDCKNFGPYCGDRMVNDQEEQCDGNSETRACLLANGSPQLIDGRPAFQTRVCKSNCRWINLAERIPEWGECTPSGACGDGVVQAEVEACDDGNRADTDSCKNDCTPNVCGDGSINVGREACDDGLDNIRPDDTNAINARRAECTYGQLCNYCTTSCSVSTLTAAICGDGTVNLGYEVCEPGVIRTQWQRVCTGTGGFCSSDDDCPGEEEICYVYRNNSQCAPDCVSACPPSYETDNLSFREVIGGVPSNRYTDSALQQSGIPVAI